jgi:hypothetical protein
MFQGKPNETRKLAALGAFQLFSKYFVVTLQVSSAFLSDFVDFSGSTAFLLFPTRQKTPLFERVKHWIQCAVPDFYAKICFNLLLDAISPD